MTSSATAVAEYAQRHEVYVAAVKRARHLIHQLCREQRIKVHLVEARAKDIQSFAEKVQRKRYTDPLRQAPDLAGLRVVVHSLGDVVRVGNLIDANFEVIESEDKQAALMPDRFGYQSLHKVFRLRPKHAALIEWNAFTDIRFEVQVRTILQHVWATTSHRVQYKREGDTPPVQQRTLARISGLLEMADEQLEELLTQCPDRMTADDDWPPTPQFAGPPSTLWSDALTKEEKEAIRPLDSPLWTRIVDCARRAGVLHRPIEKASARVLARLWTAIEDRLHQDSQMLLRRIEEDAEAVFRILLKELQVSSWSADDAHVIAAATLIALGEPRNHMYIIEGWPAGYLRAIRATMNRVQ